jgi:hypothetical protein
MATEAEMVAIYLALRDRRDARKAAFKEADAKDLGAQDKIEAMFLKKFQATGTSSMSIKGLGTAFTVDRSSCTVGDKEAFFLFLKENDMWELADIRAAKTNIEQYKEVKQELPPGINWSSETIVNVRRAA